MGKNSDKNEKIKKSPEKKKNLLRILRDAHADAITLILVLVLLVCYACYIYGGGKDDGLSFIDVFVYNMLALAGNDYEFTGTPGGRILGLIVLSLGVVGLSTITGYISSALVARRLNAERGIKKMQNMKKHIIVCGWKNDIKSLIVGILHKNKNLSVADIILITGAEDVKLQTLRDDAELKGLNILKGDFTEEQTLKNANIKEASKVLIIGESCENLDEELIDSRVFVTALLARNLNSKCHICAQIRTERYRNYLEAQNCAEIIYTEEYTRYILTTSTNYSGMSKVMSSFLDNGDGTSVQIEPISESWIGKRYGELFDWYKSEKNFLLLGILENMGVEKEIKHNILSEAQKSTNYGEIIQRLKSVKEMETNEPRLNPGDDYIIPDNCGAIILGEEI
ncbi:MAG: NAD-binding protein [Lachnospiraceae bacterium]|nr:NAD-binding protein [Lachnospiraceae bacterium]